MRMRKLFRAFKMRGDVGACGVHLCRLLRYFSGDALQRGGGLLNRAALLVYVVRPAFYLAGNNLPHEDEENRAPAYQDEGEQQHGKNDNNTLD